VQILKYPILIADEVGITMPAGARLLSVQYQESTDEICVWALVDTTAPDASRVLRIFGTGEPVDVPANTAFLGTVQMHGGALVWHIFDLGDAP
jgi:hypothetical protein